MTGSRESDWLENVHGSILRRTGRLDKVGSRGDSVLAELDRDFNILETGLEKGGGRECNTVPSRRASHGWYESSLSLYLRAGLAGSAQAGGTSPALGLMKPTIVSCFRVSLKLISPSLSAIFAREVIPRVAPFSSRHIRQTIHMYHGTQRGSEIWRNKIQLNSKTTIRSPPP